MKSNKSPSMRIKNTVLLLLGLFAIHCSHAGEWCAEPELFANAEPKTYKINDRFYVVEIINTDLMCRPGNVAVLIGDKNVLIVDTVYRHVNDFVVDEIEALSNLPIKFLINSHGHKDHSDSNYHFGRDEGTVIIGHTETRNYMSITHEVVNPNLDVVTLSAQPEEGLPHITFDEEMEVHFEEETIRLISLGPAHSAGDIAIYFTKNNAIHMGDILQAGNLPFIDHQGDIQNFMNTYDKAAALCDKDTVIIPGHGALSDCDAMVAFGNTVKLVVDRIKAGINEGKSLDEIQASRPARDFVHPELGAYPSHLFVAMAHKDLMAKRSQ